MVAELWRGVRFMVISMALVGGYHAVLWGVGRAAFPAQAEGSLLRRPDGGVIGSVLIAQKFTRREYFHARPSAVDYNAASTGGSNYGPSNPDHLAAVGERLDAITALERATPRQVPSDMLTTSGAGLDPHISPSAALLQAPRVAAAREVPLERMQALVQTMTEAPLWGFLGRPRINVLRLNLELDAALGAPTQPVSPQQE
jgi:K+-transporting ATPase ATPase C chain